MIMAEDERSRRAALDELLPLQQQDFEGIFEEMRGLPVTIRLLDPPLHEFLPNAEEVVEHLEHARMQQSEEVGELERLLERVHALAEQNPMLGTRGCRVGVLHPEIYEMQVRAMLRAASAAGACRRLAREGLVHATAGNVSARVGDRVVVTPSGAVLAELRPEDTSVVDMEGRVVEGELAPTSELFLHLGVYERFDAGAVVHTHSPIATALSCVVDELPPVHYQMLVFGGAVRVAPYATFGTPELADNVHAALEGRAGGPMQKP